MKNRPLFYIFAGVVLGEGCWCINKIMAGVLTALCLCLLGIWGKGCHFLLDKKLCVRCLAAGILLGVLSSLFAGGIEVETPSYTGTIQGMVAETGTGKTEYVRLSPYMFGDRMQKGSLLLYGEEFDVLPGSILSFHGEAEGFTEPRNPGEFDLKSYYHSRQIYYRSFTEQYEVIEEDSKVVTGALHRWKKAWLDRCFRYLPKEEAGILCAMLVGEKSYIDPEEKRLYQENGISHILAISGLHISMVGMAIYQLLRRLGGSFVISGSIALVLLGLYCCMIGNAVSAIRASTMLLFYLIADMKGRHYDMLSALSIAGMVLLITNPKYLSDAGFLLSFVAILAIGILYPAMSRISRRGQTLWMGLSLWLAMLPVQAYFFYEVSPMSIVLNWIVIPLVPVILGCGFLGMFLPVPWLFGICRIVLVFYRRLLLFQPVIIGKPTVFMLGFYVGCLFLFLKLIEDKKHILAVICIAAGIGCLCMPKLSGCSVHILDVGQGDGILLHGAEGQNYMIDGGSTDVKNVGQYRILPFLKANGIRHLDGWIITHFDADHYNGVEEFMDRYSIERIYVYEGVREDEDFLTFYKKAEAMDCEIVYIAKGDTISDGSIKLSCLFPQKGFRAEKNQQSLVFSFAYEDTSFLFTGDLELEGEEAFVEQGGSPVQILKAGHHGSKNATSKELLEQTEPQICLISCGIDNRYGHPHKEVLERLKEEGCETYITAECGCITIKERKGRWYFTTFLKDE